jgi:hypothetical protein
MTEIKVHCACGQKFKFDVEPVNGQVPFAVNCPACGADGTAAANAILAQELPPAAAPRPVAVAAFAPPPPRAIGPVPAPRAAPARAATPTELNLAAEEALRAINAKNWNARAPGEFSLLRGTLGALLGAGIGVALVLGFFLWAHFKFPWSSAGIGALTGLGARILYRGCSSGLGLVAAVVALGGWFASNLLIYGAAFLDVWFLLIISLIVSVFIAYRIASG